MAKRFKKPTPDQVTEYADSIGFQLDGEAFCDFYESKGWKVGQTPMKCWKAAVRNWKRRQKAEGNLKPSMREKYLTDAVKKTQTIQQYVRSGYDYESTNPKEALRRYWTGLRDKHGPAFIEDLKRRLKK